MRELSDLLIGFSLLMKTQDSEAEIIEQGSRQLFQNLVGFGLQCGAKAETSENGSTGIFYYKRNMTKGRNMKEKYEDIVVKVK